MIITKDNYPKVLEQVDKEENRLRRYDQVLVEEKTNAQSKSLATAWVIWRCFGIFGGPRFYLGRKKAKLMLVLSIFGIITFVFGIGAFVMLAMFIWTIVDACHLSRWVKFDRLVTKARLINEYKKP